MLCENGPRGPGRRLNPYPISHMGWRPGPTGRHQGGTIIGEPVRAEASSDALPLNRREFVYYLWDISLAVFLSGPAGASLWFALPRFRAGQFGGVFTLASEETPTPDSGPKDSAQGPFWLMTVGPQSLNDPRQPGDYPLTPGLRALNKACTHPGCLHKWVSSNDRFECPCHGSRFLRSGARIDGPARRNLDVFTIEALDRDGKAMARTGPSIESRKGTALQLPLGTVELRIDTGRRILGAPNSRPGGGL